MFLFCSIVNSTDSEVVRQFETQLRYSRKLVMAPEGRHIMAVLRRRQFSKRKGMPHVQI